MGLTPGVCLGPYEIVAPIGAGGMGEVYRARDQKLNRDVALKVLPEAVAGDPQRLSRFHREAQVLATFNHPGIAQVHGFEDSGAVHAIVMELVEGPTLAERLARGPLVLGQAMAVASQIAGALEAAHGRAIVHRDLKPANIKVGDDGTVKLLDFGLAKLVRPGVDSRGSDMPTTAITAVTESGTILGTAAYMSPEQAAGRDDTDQRTDIWAFGCVLYEMLTGRRPFRGTTWTETLGAVMRDEPDWSALPAATPPDIRTLVARCLRKDVRLRLQAIGDARIVIDDVRSGSGTSAAPEPSPRRLSIAALLTGAAGIALATGALVWSLKPAPVPVRPVTRFTIDLPPGQQLAASGAPALALSPDGSALAYVAIGSQGGAARVYLRKLAEPDAQPLPETDGAFLPFFSPDGQWIGFFAGNTLKKVSINGGASQILSNATNPGGAVWTTQHTIVFAPYLSALLQVPDSGGTPVPLTHVESGETAHLWPSVSSDGSALLFGVERASSPVALVSQAVSGPGGRRVLVETPDAAMPVVSSSGHLIYAQAGNLMAVPLDLARGTVTGVARPVAREVSQFTLSSSGTLAYVAGHANSTGQNELVWVDRHGVEQSMGAPPRWYNQPRVSPDGRRVVVDVVENAARMQVWLFDVERRTLGRFTFEGVNRHAVWTPDGARIAFMSDRDGAQQIFWQRADGTGGLERIAQNDRSVSGDLPYVPCSFSPGAHELIATRFKPASGAEVLSVSLNGASRGKDTETSILFRMRTGDGGPTLSPDGRWLAYASEESGRLEIYVQPFPALGAKWQVSTDGGNEPVWNPKGGEIFYRNQGKLMAVSVVATPAFSSGTPQQLFAGSYAEALVGYMRANYDVSPDGQHFLMLKPVRREGAPATQITVVLNWIEELSRLVPRR